MLLQLQQEAKNRKRGLKIQIHNDSNVKIDKP